MNRSWVRFPQAAQIRPPGSGWAFLCARVVLRCCLWLCGPTGVSGAAWLALMGRAAVCAGGRRPAREIATREPAARSGRSRGPPWPCHRPPAPRPGPASGDSPVPPVPPAPFPPVGPGALMCGSARRLEARPGPATAHGHRSLAIRRLRCSPHGKRWGFCTTRSLLAACRRRVEPSCSAIPPIGAAAGRGYRVWVSCLEACSILSFACNSLMPAVCSSAKSPEFQRLHFKA